MGKLKLVPAGSG